MSIWVLSLAGRWPLLHRHGRHWTRRGTQLRRLCDYLMIHDAAGSVRRRWLLLLMVVVVMMMMMHRRWILLPTRSRGIPSNPRMFLR